MIRVYCDLCERDVKDVCCVRGGTRLSATVGEHNSLQVDLCVDCAEKSGIYAPARGTNTPQLKLRLIAAIRDWMTPATTEAETR